MLAFRSKTEVDDVIHELTQEQKGLRISLRRSIKELSTSILDPWAGSGTTGRAALDMGKRAVLIEREERYCEIAAKRMSQQVLAL